jgi:hypothetical protein
MIQYKDLSGNSGVRGYEIKDHSIRVLFKNGKVYEYPASKIGYDNLAKMAELAKAGKGLATFINQNVRDDYIK